MANHDPLPSNPTETTRLLPSSPDTPNDEFLLQDEATRLAALKLIPWYRRPSIFWLVPLILLISLVIGVAASPAEQAILQIVCKEYFDEHGQAGHHPGLLSTSSSSLNGGDPSFGFHAGDNSTQYENPCDAPHIQALGAILFSKLRALKNVTALLTVGYWTGLLDRYGRKSLIWAMLLPAIFTQLVILYSSSAHNKYGSKLLYIEAFVQGATGGSTLLDPSLQSYAADTTSRDGRSLILGYMMVLLSIGMIIGPTLGAYVIEHAGGRYTAALEVTVVVLTVLLAYVYIIPESLPAEAKRRANLEYEQAVLEEAKLPQGRSWLSKLGRYLKNVFTPILIFVPGRIDTTGDVVPMPHKYTLILLITISELQQFVFFGIADIFIPYTNVRFHWKHLEDGYYYTFIGLSSFFVFMVLYPFTQWCYKKLFFKKEEEGNDVAKKTTAPSADEPTHPAEERNAHAEAVLDSARKTPRAPRGGDFTDSLMAEEETVLETAGLLAAEREGRLDSAPPQGKLETTRQTTWLEVHLFGVSSVLFFVSSIIIPLYERESTVFVSGFIRSAGQAGLTNYGSLLTMYAPPHQVGKVLGGSCVIDTITLTISALVYGWIFSRTSGTMPAFVFWIASLSAGLSILVWVVVWSLYKRHDQKVTQQQLQADSVATTRS
ncbi:hypothetical protein DFQ27_003208 [Actinomortierella ambigua]|uniref:MFS general substrate transporter n=1 Tax=Actinomortierella ambigua TaxID=1343610 RepID=A0A9P6UCI5_9FUNG|nr:hypothetical protein DFQ27_003208 [Actinomortierella ambigua]